MRYSVVIAQPPGYIHSAAFAELAELIAYGLDDLGHAVALHVNRWDVGSIPIIIGCHLLPPAFIADVPAEAIVLNTEQLRTTGAGTAISSNGCSGSKRGTIAPATVSF